MDPIDLASARRRRQFPYEPDGSDSSWQKYLAIATLVIGLATAGLYLFDRIRDAMTSGEGELIVNVNTATQEELETIPHIGPYLANEIIRERPYKHVDELIRVKGIGKYLLNKIRPYVKVDGPTERRTKP